MPLTATSPPSLALRASAQAWRSAAVTPDEQPARAAQLDGHLGGQRLERGAGGDAVELERDQPFLVAAA